MATNRLNVLSPVFCNKFEQLNERVATQHNEANEKNVKKNLLFVRGSLCPFCETKLYSYRHVNEHLSYEHNVHIELEELVFFIPDEFHDWKAQMEQKTNAKYEEYICPLSLIHMPKIPKKTYYRCVKSIPLGEGRESFCCPSSLQTYMEDGALKVSFWRSHLCQDTIPISADCPVNGMEMNNFSAEQVPNNTPNLTANQEADYTQPLKGPDQDKQKALKEELKKFTKRVLQTDLTKIDPNFVDTLDKVLPFLNKTLDQHEIAASLKADGRRPFIYYPSSDEEEQLTDDEDEQFLILKKPRGFAANLTKRNLSIEDCGELQRDVKRLKVAGSNGDIYEIYPAEEPDTVCTGNSGTSSNSSSRNRSRSLDENRNELFIHKGFDHIYTKVY